MTQYGVTALNKDQAIVCGLCLVLDHLLSSLRASREAVVRGVTPLGKDMPLPARRALRPTTSRLAEHGNITLKEC
ncbi:MAG: hypothetical protein V3R56_05130 [Xanthomonadales bacterium]